MKKFFQSLLWPSLLTLIVALPTLASYHFGSQGMYECHDHIMSIVRLWNLDQAMKSGILAPNWISSFALGYGSPIFLFSWFLPYYLGILIHHLGFTLVDSAKSLFLISYFLSGLTIFLLAKKLTVKSLPALMAIPVYLWAPFHLNTVFARCSLGESWAMVLIPLFFLFLMGKSRKQFIMAILTLSALSLSHNIDYIFTLGLLGLWAVIIDSANSYRQRRSLLVGVLSLLLTAFFWLPAFLEQNFIHYFQMAGNIYATQLVSFLALLNSPWQYGPPSPTDPIHSLSFQLGKIHWMIILFLPILVIFRKKMSPFNRRISLFLVLILAISLVLELPQSRWLWDHLSVIQIILFPWRLQLVAIFSLAILSSMIMTLLPCQKTLAIFLFSLLFLANRHHFYQPLGDFASDGYIAALGHDGSSWGEYLPRWVDLEQYQKQFATQDKPTNIIQNNQSLKLIDQDKGINSLSLHFKALAPTRGVFNQYYFPGWKAKIDHEDAAVLNSSGYLSLSLPSGNHQVTLFYAKTQARQLSERISMLTLITLIGWQLVAWWMKKYV